MITKRKNICFGLLTASGIFYVVDCLTVIIAGDHPGVPWYESGIYAASPFGIFMTGGFLLYVIAVVGVGALVAGLHYLMWGRAYTEETAGLREEMEAQEELDETRRPRHF